MSFWKGGRYRCSEVRGIPTTPIILCNVVSVSRSYVTLSVSRSYVTRLFEVDTDFKNVFMLKSDLNVTCFYYTSIRSLSLGASFRYNFLILVALSVSSLHTMVHG